MRGRQVELAGRLVAALLDYGVLRLRPDVLAWAEQVTDADPDDRSPLAAAVWAVSGYAAWMAGDVAEADLLEERGQLAAQGRVAGPRVDEIRERGEAVVPEPGVRVDGRHLRG